MMDREIVYEKTGDYVRGRWMNIVLILAGIWGINFVIGLILGGSSTASMMTDFANSVQHGGSDGEIGFNLVNSFIQGARRDWLRGILQAAVSSMLTAGFTMALLDSFRKNETVSFESVFENIQKHAIEIIVAALIIGVVETVVGFVPIIGAIASAVLSYMFAFVFFIIKEHKQEDVVSSIKASIEMTKGHKMNLFMIDLYYLFRPLLALILIPVGGFLVARDQLALGFLIMFAGLIATVVLAIRYIPYTHVAHAVYYAEVNSFSEAARTEDFEEPGEFDEFDDFDDFDEFDSLDD